MSEHSGSLEPEPSDIVGRLRYWGKSKSRMRRAYTSGSHMRLFNEAANALEAERKENERLREALDSHPCEFSNCPYHAVLEQEDQDEFASGETGGVEP